MAAQVIQMKFDWSAHHTRGRRRLVLEPGQSVTVDHDRVLQATVNRGADGVEAFIDLYSPVRPPSHRAMGIGCIRRIGQHSLYLRAITTRDGWPEALVFDVQLLDDGGALVEQGA